MTTLQEKAAALLARIDEGQDMQRRGGPLSPDDRALILRLGAKGMPQIEIAKVVGCHQATVSRTLALLDTRAEARMILDSGAAKMADTVVNTKDAGIALKALAKVDVVREDVQGGNNNVLVVVPPLDGDRSGPRTGDAGYELIDGTPVSVEEMARARNVIVIGQPGRPVALPTIEAKCVP